MRRPIIFSVIFGVTTFLSINVNVQAGETNRPVSNADLRWNVMESDEKAIVDRMARDFYEAALRHSQASAIEDQTAAMLRGADEFERAKLIAERRAQWRDMTAAQRRSLRDAKTPKFENLTDEQKQPFRQHAIDALEASGAISRAALATALRNEV